MYIHIYTFFIDVIIKYLTAHPWSGKMLTGFYEVLEEIQKREECDNLVL